MKVKFLKLVFVLFIFGISSFGYAGTVTSSKIDYVQVNHLTGNYDVVVIKFVTAPVNSPGCTTDDRMQGTLSTSSGSGKGVLAMALAAQASGRSVFVEGTGACSGGLETIAYIRVL